MVVESVTAGGNWHSQAVVDVRIDPGVAWHQITVHNVQIQIQNPAVAHHEPHPYGGQPVPLSVFLGIDPYIPPGQEDQVDGEGGGAGAEQMDFRYIMSEANDYFEERLQDHAADHIRPMNFL